MRKKALPTSSSLVYLTKSFLRTRMRMVARNPVSNSTVTQELMMLNQWICRQGCDLKTHFIQMWVTVPEQSACMGMVVHKQPTWLSFTSHALVLVATIKASWNGSKI